jgi:hypothetical protein
MHAFVLAFLDCTGQAEPDGDIDVPIVVTMSPTICGRHRYNTSHEAQLRLITKLKNQRVFTQMAYLGGENGGGMATGGRSGQ